MAINDDINAVLDSGLEVISRTSGDCKNAAIHMSIVGGVRRVEYYPTTGTVYSHSHNGFETYKQKHANVNVAIRVAKEGN